MIKETFQKDMQLSSTIQEILHDHIMSAFDEALESSNAIKTGYDVKRVFDIFEHAYRARGNDIMSLLYSNTNNEKT